MIKKLSFILFNLIPSAALAADVLDKKLKPASPPSLLTFADNVRKFLLGFAGILAVLFIIYGGIQYMLAGANPEQAEKAKKTLTYAIIGVILILLSEVILSFFTQSTIFDLFKPVPTS